MMFAAGALGASCLWVLALVVARYYGDFRRWDGWAELKLDGANFARMIRGDRLSGFSTGIERVGVMAMLVYSAGLVGFVLHAQLS